MLTYLRAKAAEYAIVLSWLDRELSVIAAKRPVHDGMVAQLRRRLAEARELHAFLRSISSIGHPWLLRRGLPIVHDLEYRIYVIVHYYVATLHREDEDDLALRDLLLETVESCGMDWIEDIAVRLDGPHATWSGWTEIPVFIAPRQHAVSLLDMAGLYHELGHNVFKRFDVAAKDLGKAVNDYFRELGQQLGPMSPDKKAERERAVRDAYSYWKIPRLAEIFSDIWATFVCGPAYYYSCVDMALRSNCDPFEVDFEDEHPPLAARVYACRRTLDPTCSKEEVATLTGQAWDSCLRGRDRNSQFDLVCAEALLDRLTATAIGVIVKTSPGTTRYNSDPIVHSQADRLARGGELRNVLNMGTRILLTHPDRYGDWERQVFAHLKSVESRSSAS